jgi:hypothetical protein
LSVARDVTIRGMNLRAAVILTLLAACAQGTASAAEHPALARARMLYNAADYDGAIESAATARAQPASADAAALVAARSHLERFHLHGDPADLTAAREELASVHVSVLTPRDQVDHLVGLGQSLYFGNSYGAAAEMFEIALAQGTLLGHRDRLLLLDWWATALDREAQERPLERRTPAYQRIATRMQEELLLDPGSAPANYWLAAASRGAGDLDRAWDVAVAGWVRARLSPESTEALRSDLERLVTQALIPERNRAKPSRDPMVEWQEVKEQWP